MNESDLDTYYKFWDTIPCEHPPYFAAYNAIIDTQITISEISTNCRWIHFSIGNWEKAQRQHHLDDDRVSWSRPAAIAQYYQLAKLRHDDVQWREKYILEKWRKGMLRITPNG